MFPSYRNQSGFNMMGTLVVKGLISTLVRHRHSLTLSHWSGTLIIAFFIVILATAICQQIWLTFQSSEIILIFQVTENTRRKSKYCTVIVQSYVLVYLRYHTVQKMKVKKNFFRKYDQIRSFLRIWRHLLRKSLMENFIFCVASVLIKVYSV